MLNNRILYSKWLQQNLYNFARNFSKFGKFNLIYLGQTWFGYHEFGKRMTETELMIKGLKDGSNYCNVEEVVRLVILYEISKFQDSLM